MELQKAICCHCSGRCGVLVGLADGRPASIAGDPSHPVSRGFTCKRGLAALEYFEHPGRLDVPLRRVGKRGQGRWEQVGWDEAVDDIATRLAAIRDRLGSEAVAYLAGTFHGTDQGIGVRFMHLFGSPNYGGPSTICAGPKIEAEALTYGFGPSAPDARPGETRCVLLWGHHPSASFPVQWGRILASRHAGARLVAIDPVRTDEAQAADLWLQLRPGTDAALALGLLHVMVQEGLYDRAFVERWTLGFEALRQRVAAYPPQRVAELTWLTPEQIVDCARLYASERPAALSHGSPNGMGRNALSCERALALLIALSGNLDRRGGNRLPGPPERVRTKVDFEWYEALPISQRAKQLGADRFRLPLDGYERLGQAGRRLWPGHEYVVDATYGAAAHAPSIFRAILEQQPYPVRALLVQHNNAIGCYPNAGLVRAALASPNLELLVVHELFMTPTAAYADYVLPATSWLEKSYLYVSGWNGLVVATPRAVAPQHERHSDYDLFRDLGARLGQAVCWPPTLEALWDHLLEPAGLTFGELSTRAQNWIDDAAPPERHERLDPSTGAPLGFATPSHKVELASSILAELGYDPLPGYEEPLDDPGQERDYPLLLMAGATHPAMTHQDHRQIASLRRQHPDPTVRVHPATAAELGLAEGDWAWIESPTGRIRQRVQLAERVHPRVVDAERWWYPERQGAEPELFGALESNVSVLTDDDPQRCDPAYGSWAFRLGRCRVSRAGSWR
ncbi:MAG: molybdopterin-dependent oxidoreductase [Chloroflexi bacterium]|nr:molybdopterin-dependent oxidoreductase [Chloroflexota bacterium]